MIAAGATNGRELVISGSDDHLVTNDKYFTSFYRPMVDVRLVLGGIAQCDWDCLDMLDDRRICFSVNSQGAMQFCSDTV
jgi:hypothetical protein